MIRRTYLLGLLALLCLTAVACKSKQEDAPQMSIEQSTAQIRMHGTPGGQVFINGKEYALGSDGNLFLQADQLPENTAGKDKLTITAWVDDLEELLINQASLPGIKSLEFESSLISDKPLRLELSGLTALESLWIRGKSQIPALDLSALKKLESLSFGGRSGGPVPIHRVKLPAGNKIRWIELFAPLTDEDLDLANFPALEGGELGYTRFTTIAFPNSPKLESLVVGYPEVEQLVYKFTANPKLRGLNLWGDQKISSLTVQGAPEFEPHIPSEVSVRALAIQDIPKDKVVRLLDQLKQRDALESVTLPGYGFRAGEAPLVGFPNLKTVHL